MHRSAVSFCRRTATDSVRGVLPLAFSSPPPSVISSPPTGDAWSRMRTGLAIRGSSASRNDRFVGNGSEQTLSRGPELASKSYRYSKPRGDVASAIQSRKLPQKERWLSVEQQSTSSSCSPAVRSIRFFESLRKPSRVVSRIRLHRTVLQSLASALDDQICKPCGVRKASGL
jgi:hypothetical protein